MSLFDGLPLDAYDTPRSQARPVAFPAPEAPTVQERPYTVTIKRASNGQEIMLCNISPAPANAQKLARARGLALFTFAEIGPMRQVVEADPRALDQIIAAKLAFPGSGQISYTPETP